MKTYQKLQRFPLGAIRAEGFLKEQMCLGKDGMAGHLYELEPEMIEAPYLRDFDVPAWSKTEATGWGAEISGNYWAGYIQFAFTLNDPEMIKTATWWVDTMLKRQKADGYLGTYLEDSEIANKYEDYNAWGTACGMRGLLAFYEATGRPDVLSAVHRCMLWFCREWAKDRKTCYAGPNIIEVMVITYYYTGDEQLIVFCEEYMDFLRRNDLFDISYESMLTKELHYNSNHTAGLGFNIRLPALVYSITGNERYLQATEKRISEIHKIATHLSGSPVSVAEFVGPVGCTTETEYCSYATYNQCYYTMGYITGQAKYGDYMEQLFYNGAQGARKKDEKAIAYLNAPNQIFATMDSSSGMRDDQVYAPCFPVACCPVNSVAVVPEFVRSMLLRNEVNDVYVMVYGPCTLDYEDLHLRVDTMYPFRNSVRIKLDCQKHFALHLRVPQWSKGYQVQINGQQIELLTEKNGFVVVERDWQQGDELSIQFQAQIEVVTVDDSDAGGKFPLAIKYGALLFAYHIPESWEPTPGRPMTPLPEGWHWYNVMPVHEQPDVPDIHERNGMLKYVFPWNIALDETLTAEDITIEAIDDVGYVWANAPIRLHTHCYRAPYLSAPYQCKTFEPYGKYQYVTEKLPLILEPYGCTNLRITYFPKADPKCLEK